MKLGCLTVPLYSMTFEAMVEYLSSLGVQAVELGAGAFPGNTHLNPDELLDNPARIHKVLQHLKKYNMTISAISIHGNPVHPNLKTACGYREDFERAVRLAGQMEVDTVITFSGCPGSDPDAKRPSWVTNPWPDEFVDILRYQWNDVLIPYWKEAAALANSYGIYKIAIEMHPNFCVYNPETLLKLRAAVGDTIGANLDPSHLFWQGIDPVAAIRALGPAIYHMHVKDTRLDPANMSVNGVLDNKLFTDALHRAWNFRTVGYGHERGVWKEIVSNLRMVGYDGTLSIEHEDGLMSITEGLEKAVSFMRGILMVEPPPEMWWINQ